MTKPASAVRRGTRAATTRSSAKDFGDQTVVYRRVVPQALPARLKTEPLPLTVQEAEVLLLRASKKQELLFLSCTVYDRRVTEMRWEHGGHRYRAFSNIDGNYLRGLHEFETADTVYLLMLGIGEEAEADLLAANASAPAEGSLGATPTRLPPREAFDSSQSQFLLPQDSRTPPGAALVGVDALHRYFQANKPALIAQYEQRQAAEAERQRRLRDQPPAAKETVIEYWTIEAATKAGIITERAQP